MVKDLVSGMDVDEKRARAGANFRRAGARCYSGAAPAVEGL